LNIRYEGWRGPWVIRGQYPVGRGNELCAGAAGKDDGNIDALQ
jgi:hypothetical protein